MEHFLKKFNSTICPYRVTTMRKYIMETVLNISKIYNKREAERNVPTLMESLFIFN